MHKFDLFGFVRPSPLTYWVLTPKFIVSYSCPTKHLCRFPSKLVSSVTRIILYSGCMYFLLCECRGWHYKGSGAVSGTRCYKIAEDAVAQRWVRECQCCWL